jgi:hypothetical protein
MRFINPQNWRAYYEKLVIFCFFYKYIKNTLYKKIIYFICGVVCL